MRCPTCGGDEFAYNYERGEVVCKVCGTVVLEQLLDLGPEWRASGEKGKRARTSAPLTRLVSEALTTVIDWKDVSGKELDTKRKLEVNRLRKLQTRSRFQTPYERNFIQAAQELERLRSAMGIPRPCIEQAMEIYRQALEKGVARGRSVEAMAAAALYTACRMLKTPRPLDEFARYTKTPKEEVARCYRLLLSELNVKVPISDPALYIPRIADQLKLSGEVVKTAIEIIRKARRATTGSRPATVAAAAVYLAAHICCSPITYAAVAAAAGTTPAAVRDLVRKMRPFFSTSLRMPLPAFL